MEKEKLRNYAFLIIILSVVIVMFFIFYSLLDIHLKHTTLSGCLLTKVTETKLILTEIERLEDLKRLCQIDCSWIDDKIKIQYEKFDIIIGYDCEKFVEEYLN